MRSGKGYIFLQTALAYYIGGDCFAGRTFGDVVVCPFYAAQELGLESPEYLRKPRRLAIAARSW